MTSLVCLKALIVGFFAFGGPVAVAQPPVVERVTMAEDDKTTLILHKGGIVRGPRHKREMALVFTGGRHGESALDIADTLKSRSIPAGLFLIGEFLHNPEYAPIIARWREDGHYIGPHSEEHPLYASWDETPKLLVTRDQFTSDLQANFRSLQRHGIKPDQARVFIPPYEHYTPEISKWSLEEGVVLVNYTTGTRSHADYLPENHPRFISGRDIVKGILDYETRDPDGLNGFILLMHVGTGPERQRERLSDELPKLLDELQRRGYGFRRIDDLIGAPQSQGRSLGGDRRSDS